MTNNPMLHYKPGLTMDTPIAVTVAAADWAILMAWFSNLPDDTENGVKHIIYGVIGEQLTAALYTPASIQGAKAYYAERTEQPVVRLFGGLIPTQDPVRAEDAEQPLLARCPNCGRVEGFPSAPCVFCTDYES